MSLKLLIADDEDIIRNGVSKYIQLHTNRFDRIYEAADGKTAIELMLKYEPDLMLLDVQMPINNGIDVMREAQKYIEEHYSEPLTLVDVAEQVGISGGYLSMMFPQTLHMGFVDYLNQVRIEHACTRKGKKD